MDIHDLEFPIQNGRRQYQQSLELADIAGKMQVYGWLVDREAAQRHLVTAQERQTRYRDMFSELSGITELGKDGTVDAVRNYFWNVLEAPVVSIDKKTKKKKLDKAALVEYTLPIYSEQLRKCSAAMYGFRRNGKVIGYMHAYLEASALDGRVHPRWNVWGTKTSRWSCTAPNLQQLSGRAPKFDFGNGPETLVDALKDILVADPGFVLVGADYSALELYIQTYIAQAQKLLGWMDVGKDLHMENAKAVLKELGLPADATKSTHKVPREIAKLFFGFAYNGSDKVTQVYKQMKDKLPKLKEKSVEIWRKNYFKLHPEFPGWQHETKVKLSNEGFITTPLMDRRLYLMDTPRGVNQALNGQAQITAGDLANIAIIRLAKHINWKNNAILAQVHDSFITQCRPDGVGEMAAAITKAMTDPVQIYGITAKFAAEPDYGPNWQDMKGF